MWPVLSTLLNWMTIFEWYMARLVVRMDTKKACGAMRLEYVLIMRTLLYMFNNKHN